MDGYTILAFAVGFIIPTIFFIIKNKKLIDADKAASQIIAVLSAVLNRYSEAIKA